MKKIDIAEGLKEHMRNFNFISENDFNYFLFLIKRLYMNLTNKDLLVEIMNK